MGRTVVILLQAGASLAPMRPLAPTLVQVIPVPDRDIREMGGISAAWVAHESSSRAGDPDIRRIFLHWRGQIPVRVLRQDLESAVLDTQHGSKRR